MTMARIWQQFLIACGETGNWLVVALVVLSGYLAGKAAQKCRLPSIVGYLVAGVVLGSSVLDVINHESVGKLDVISDFGLGIVAFMIGTELSYTLIKRMGRGLFYMILAESFVAVGLVFVFVMIASHTVLEYKSLTSGGILGAALIFAAMAAASAPAGTVAVIQEYRAKGPLTSLLLAIVGLDDGLAIVIYAVIAVIAKMLLVGSGEVDVLMAVEAPLIEIAGSLTLGCVTGLVIMLLLKRNTGRGEILTVTIGGILLATGVANMLHLSLILTNLALGMFIANMSKKTVDKSYNAVSSITHPVFVLFFVIAGAHLELKYLLTMGLLVPIYILGRSAGKISGAYLGASLAKAEPRIKRNLGMGLLSQAGVAIGLALMVAREFSDPRYGPGGEEIAVLVINTVAATTIFFEVIGPITAKIALTRAGEINCAEASDNERS